MADRSSPADARQKAWIVAEARAWIGTPYHHQESLKGVGCDCLGLLRGVWRALYGPEPIAAPPYSRDWAEAALRETLLDACAATLIPVPMGANVQPGDVMVFRMAPGRMAKHCGIVGFDGAMIHALEGVGVIEERWSDFLAARRTARIAESFSFPAP